jgi:hypothetical protein
MKQVVVYIEPDKHTELKEEAKANRRTMGQQLLVKAFGVGMPVRPAPQKKGGKSR